MIRFRLLDKFVVILVVFFYYCDFILYIGNTYHDKIINQKTITLALFLPLFLFLVILKHIRLNSTFSRPLVRWLLVYFFASIYALLININANSAFDIFRTVIFSTLIMILITGFLDDIRRLQFALKCVMWGMLFTTLMNAADFLMILPLSIIPGRAAGYYLNPNSAGIALSFGLILVTGKVPERWHTLFVFMSGLGIVLTFSRAAIIFYIFFLIYYIFFLKSVSKNVKIFSVFIFLGMIFYFNQKIINLFGLGSAGNSDLETRISFIRHPIENESDVSSDTRVGVLKFAAERVINNPIIGYGLGYDHDLIYNDQNVQSHDQYLDFLLDYGIIGAFILLYYFTWLRKRMNKKSKILFRNYLLTFLYFCFFSHNLFQEYSMLFIHALAWMLITRKEKAVLPNTPLLREKKFVVSLIS